MKFFTLEQIQEVIDFKQDLKEILSLQKAAFIDFSKGLYEIPLPMQLIFPHNQGDCHIKGSFKKESKTYVIKIANSSNFGPEGLILVFSREKGNLQAVLHDHGWLTTLRTAAAGLLIGKIIPWKVKNIGILGSGNLAKILYTFLKQHFKEVKLNLYARNLNKARNITPYVCNSVQELVQQSDLIFTATSSHNPLIKFEDIKGRKAIIGLGSDDEYKQEIEKEIFFKSDIVIVDSKNQAMKYGDAHYALNSGILLSSQTIELGHILKHGLQKDARLIVANLTGIASQDTVIAEFTLSRLYSAFKDC